MLGLNLGSQGCPPPSFPLLRCFSAPARLWLASILHLHSVSHCLAWSSIPSAKALGVKSCMCLACSAVLLPALLSSNIPSSSLVVMVRPENLCVCGLAVSHQASPERFLSSSCPYHPHTLPQDSPFNKNLPTMSAIICQSLPVSHACLPALGVQACQFPGQPACLICMGLPDVGSIHLVSTIRRCEQCMCRFRPENIRKRPGGLCPVVAAGTTQQ